MRCLQPARNVAYLSIPNVDFLVVELGTVWVLLHPGDLADSEVAFREFMQLFFGFLLRLRLLFLLLLLLFWLLVAALLLLFLLFGSALCPFLLLLILLFGRLLLLFLELGRLNLLKLLQLRLARRRLGQVREGSQHAECCDLLEHTR